MCIESLPRSLHPADAAANCSARVIARAMQNSVLGLNDRLLSYRHHDAGAGIVYLSY